MLFSQKINEEFEAFITSLPFCLTSSERSLAELAFGSGALVGATFVQETVDRTISGPSNCPPDVCDAANPVGIGG
ncbi:MAG: hypothetical protein KGL39_42040 [Patescibacteria group bacterium]|nr:hypothetical protein [Patescibacteria group bacterium]